LTSLPQLPDNPPPAEIWCQEGRRLWGYPWARRHQEARGRAARGGVRPLM